MNYTHSFNVMCEVEIHSEWEAGHLQDITDTHSNLKEI